MSKRTGGQQSPSQLVGRLRWYLVAALFATCLLLPGFAEAATGPWSAPVKISGNSDAGWFPAVAADNAGNVYVVWNGSFADGPKSDAQAQAAEAVAQATGSRTTGSAVGQVAALYFTHWNGKSWTKPNDIGLDWWGAALRSSLVTDQTGRLHLIRLGIGDLVSRAADPEQSLYSQDLWHTSADGASADSVQGWSTPTRITQSSQGYFSDMAIDHQGVIHAIYTESANGSWGIYYTHSTDGGATWSDRVPLDENNPVWWYRAHLTVDALDRVHIVWEVLDPEGNYGSMIAAVYALSEDGGTTWSKTVFVGNQEPQPYTAAVSKAFERVGAPLGPQQPAIGVDGKGTILLVYRVVGPGVRGDRIFYRQSTDGVHWSKPELIPGVAAGVSRPYDIYDMATDSAGHVHLVTVGYPANSTTMSLLHSEWDGQKWSEPQVVASSPPYPEYPRIVVGEGNRLDVVWFDGDRASVDRTAIGIWYSSAQSSSPAVAGAPVAVAASAPSTSSALPTPSPMPSPTQSAQADTELVVPAESLSRSPAWLAPIVQSPDYPLIMGLGPVVPLLLIVAIVKLQVFALLGRMLGGKS